MATNWQCICIALPQRSAATVGDCLQTGCIGGKIDKLHLICNRGDAADVEDNDNEW